MGDDTFATRRHLPHLEKSGKTYFSTFATRFREVLTPSSRSIALSCCLHDHESAYWLECAVVMPDHVHLIFTPFEGKRLSTIMDAIKGASSHLINRATGRRGRLWGDESFHRIVRSSENLRAKCEYVCNNPVRAGLVTSPDEWPWLWRSGTDGVRDRRGPLSA